MTNDEMKSGRFLRWHKARRTAARITAHLSAGRKVMIATHTRATIYTLKHLPLFRPTRTGLYVRTGQGWECIDYCAIRYI